VVIENLRNLCNSETMKSPVLILFIILNVLAVSTVSAASMYDEQTLESRLVSSQGSSVLANCLDESSCSGFCHVFSHMLGVISYALPLAELHLSSTLLNFNERLHLFLVEPPLHPPQFLIEKTFSPLLCI
jgi:hypothetical protein